MEKLFIKPLVIDQSKGTYLLLNQLLARTQALAKKATDQEKEICLFLFDGFRDILLNNLNALYESERQGLEILIRPETEGDYLQTTLYPGILQMVLWRLKTREDHAQTISQLEQWQKVLRFSDAHKLKEIYDQSELEKRDEYYKKHTANMPNLMDFEVGF